MEDSVLVALIRESLEAPERPRRLAAYILLEVLRNGIDFDVSQFEKIEAETAPMVADEIRALAEHHRLLGDDR